MQLHGAAGEERKRWRRHRRLRHVEDFHARAHGLRRALEIHGFDEAVHRRRRNALAAIRGDLFQQRKDFLRAFVAFRRDEDDRRVVQKFTIVAQALFVSVPVAFQLPTNCQRR